MGMFDDGSYNEGVNVGRRIAIGSVVASFAVLGILGITVLMNSGNNKHHNNNDPYTAKVEKSTEEQVSVSEDRETRTSDELSFWNMYDKEEEEKALVVSENKEAKKETKKSAPSKNAVSQNKKALSDNKGLSDNSVSENKFNIKPSGEKPEYVSVNALLPKTQIDEENFSMEKGRLTYNQGGRNVSHFGIDVSKYNGTISWNRVKNDGVEFALIRVGARGYSSGSIVLDEKFKEYYNGCSENSIDVGVYFYSQAISTQEAVEEANYCVAALGGKKIKYPVIFDSEKVLNDSYRTENLSSTELTNIFKAFADTVRSYGYTPMVGGTKEQLVKHFDLEDMTDYDVWLLDVGEKTEYPYRYSIRQYADDGKVDGINGKVNYDICMISYAEK
ncbi:MAG: glycoside hydrolase family 25 protein [Lachnospiraceae bacterium]|nr:glycoside hydrolase family 25 protein [Lachnospiraceae bacterium]